MSLNHTKEYNRQIRDAILKGFALAAAIAKGPLQKRSCPVCNCAESRFFANNDFLDYEQCSRCSLIYMNPAPPAETVNNGFLGEDQLLMDYFAIVDKFRSKVFLKPDPLTDSQLIDIFRVKQSGSLLDIGCSFGNFLHKAKFFYDVEGVEVNPYTASIAEADFLIHKNYLSELNLGKQYDIITLNQILYGVPDPASLLRDIHGNLADDGILYINTPNADSYAMQLYQGKANHLQGYTTLNVFNRRSLEFMVAQSGFKVLSFRTEWLDIYLADLAEFYDHPERFIHKRNCHLSDYEDKIVQEDMLHKSMHQDLGHRGNYLVAVLCKADDSSVMEGGNR